VQKDVGNIDASLATPRAVQQLISEHGFVFRRSLGQNFLVDGNVLRNIVRAAQITRKDTVIEIGAGIGTLTRALASTAERVLAIEIDARLHPILQETVERYGNVEVLAHDALKLDWQVLWDDYDLKQAKLVANLPYYITSPLLVNVLTEELPWDNLTVMMQREVAERLTAKRGTKSYGTLTVLASYYSDVEICQIVPPTVFMPQPDVDSAVVRFTMRPYTLEVHDPALLWRVIKASFAQRRKTLGNNLAAALSGILTKAELESILQALGIDSRRRAETLSLQEFVVLVNRLEDCI